MMIRDEIDLYLEAMSAEIERSMKSLWMPEHERPYFISYLVRDETNWHIWGRYGHLYRNHTEDFRRCYCNLRVGSYKFDHSLDGGLSANSRKNESYNWMILPIEASAEAVRYSLWRLTHEKYREALDDFYYKKRTMAVERIPEERPADFSREPRVEHFQDRPAPHFDRDLWTERIRRLSRAFRRYPEIMDPYLELKAERTARLLVNSEGSRIHQEFFFLTLDVSAWTQCEDGSYEGESSFFSIADPEDYPGDDAVEQAVHKLVQRLREIKDAPRLLPATGPALLAPGPAGVFFHEAIGHRLEGERFITDEEGQTFKDKIGQQVLPPFIDIDDDPTMATFDGKRIFGSYAYDDEGVAAENVKLVDRGVLKGLLLSRKTVIPYEHSNGHGRAENHEEPISRMANLVVRCNEPLSGDELFDAFEEEIRKSGNRYGFIIGRVRGGETNTERYDFQAFKGEMVEIYRYDLETRRKERVRGIDFIGTPLAALQKVVAAGDDLMLDNAYCGAESGTIPVSTIAPSIVVSEIELQKAMRKRFHPPITPTPMAGEN